MKERSFHHFSLGPILWALILVLLGSCVAGEGGRSTASCATGQSYDSFTRSCQGAEVEPGPPTPTLESLSLVEDSGLREVLLTYVDSENDLVTSCHAEAVSSPGFVMQKIDQGILYQSVSGLSDAYNTRVTLSLGGVLGIVTDDTSLFNIRQVNITVTTTTTTVDVANLINSNGVASSWLSALALENNLTPLSAAAFSLDEIPCTCLGGACRAHLIPADNWHGSTEFTYTLTDEDGESDAQTVRVNITSVNDDPVLTVNISPLFQDGLGNAFTENFDGDTSFYSGNLIADGVVTLSDESDGNPSGTGLSLELVSGAFFGEVTLAPNGDYTYRTYANEVSDSFQIRAVDAEGGRSSNATLTLTIATVDDPPLGTLTTLGPLDEDSGVQTYTLTYRDEEGAQAISCEITALSHVYPVGGCSCDAAHVCTVDLAPLPNENGSSSFSYRLNDAVAANDAYLSSQNVTFTINSLGDNPILFPSSGGTSIQVPESDTFVAPDYSFTLDSAFDPDSGEVVADSDYTLATGGAPSLGTLSGCLGIDGATGLNCTYTPADGNLSDAALLDPSLGSPDLSSVNTTATGVFYRSVLGDTYDPITISLVNISSGAESMATLYGALAMAYLVDPTHILILYETGVTTGDDLATAINGSAEISPLVRFVSNGAIAQTGDEVLILSGTGASTVDFFSYSAGGTTQSVHISITPTDDRPTMCEYSTYADTTACGLRGCIGNSIPSIYTPDKDGLVFYSLLTGACYISSGGQWQAVESHIANRSVNELDPIVIDNIRVDEGGGSGEDGDSISILNIDSSDENLIPLGNIEFFDSTGTSLGTGETISLATPLDMGDGAASADLTRFRLRIIPQTIDTDDDEKQSEIEITISDGSLITEVVFTVTVLKSSVIHGGWISFSSTGPKVDSFGLVGDDRDVCPYSLDMCEGGQKCYGTSSPVGNQEADPDHVDAIFMEEGTSGTLCYRMGRTQIQYLSYVNKTDQQVSIEYVDAIAGTTDTASISSVGTDSIRVEINDEVTTTDTIIGAIEANATTAAMVKVINLKLGETQDIQESVSLAPMGNGNWELFKTNCNASPAALEPACSLGGVKLSCVGTRDPTSLGITPTQLDSRFWDEQSKTCYRSVGTASANDWRPYGGPAEITLSWNEFRVNGGAGVDEYRVFRRLAGEEFDFSLPLNKKSISSSGSSFTFSDNNENSIKPPAPGTVYYYVVRAVVNGLLTSTAAEGGTSANGLVRMMAPPQNMVFVHRWMINKSICSLMNRDPDTTQNYRCEYTGAGDTLVDGQTYYDYGQDLLVDRFEAGCPFSTASRCLETSDHSCIGVAGSDEIAVQLGLFYYDRSHGMCYLGRNDGGGPAWTLIEGATPGTAISSIEVNGIQPFYNRSGLPPWTNISQAGASLVCENIAPIDSNSLLGYGAPAGTLSRRLPTRKDQVAYSQWDNNKYTNSEISLLERGLSLNSTSKCNSSQGSGLSDAFVDIDKPDSNDFYTLPGTYASGIRSFATGSDELSACVSLFGVQDAIGNVAEWTSHQLDCSSLSTCAVVAPSTLFSSEVTTDEYGVWALDGQRGPCVDTNADGICDGALTSWAYEDERFGGGRFMAPLGLVSHVNSTSTFNTDYDLFEIGPSSGITSSQLHDDTLNINSDIISSTGTGIGDMVTGGSYLSGEGAGVWNMELLPNGGDALGGLTIQDISFRVTDPAAFNYTIQYEEGAGANSSVFVDSGAQSITVTIGTDTGQNQASVLQGLLSPTLASIGLDPFISGDSGAAQSATIEGIRFNDFRDTGRATRSDVGFRCVIDLDQSFYDE